MENKLTVTINKTELPIKEHSGQRVVTLKEIDAVHERPEGQPGSGSTTTGSTSLRMWITSSEIRTKPSKSLASLHLMD